MWHPGIMKPKPKQQEIHVAPSPNLHNREFEGVSLLTGPFTVNGVLVSPSAGFQEMWGYKDKVFLFTDYP